MTAGTMKNPQPTQHDPGILKRIWRSVFRGPVLPRDDRERKWVVFNHWILHFRPVRLPEKTIRYTHTWGLGGMSATLFMLLVATGGLLMFVYEPSCIAPMTVAISTPKKMEATVINVLLLFLQRFLQAMIKFFIIRLFIMIYRLIIVFFSYSEWKRNYLLFLY